MADDTATAPRSKRQEAAAEAPIPGLPADRQAEARERLEYLRHRRGCPVEEHGMNASYKDDDGVDKVARVEFFIARQVTKNTTDAGVRIMDTSRDAKPEIVVVRCLECGEQEPSD